MDELIEQYSHSASQEEIKYMMNSWGTSTIDEIATFCVNELISLHELEEVNKKEFKSKLLMLTSEKFYTLADNVYEMSLK